MTWTLLVALVVALGIALFASLARRNELARMERQVRERERAVRQGSAAAQLRHPVVDLSRCLGCGTCVRACPEEGVLDLVHGQAMVVNGARCVGHAACERECPVGAITVTLTNLESRRDVPVIDESLEVVGTPGLFLAGEVTAHALIKTAIEHGVAVGAEVARRTSPGPGVARANEPADVLDLVVVGAGPAGLACSLEAKRHGLRFVTVDQESAAGGTVAKYPRRKLVLTQPVDLPLHGRLDRTTYTKEELVELWQRIAVEQDLPIHTGAVFEGVTREANGVFTVTTSVGVFRARCVCLALGRRGTPRRLDVPGEELAKVSYSLLDANSYQGRKLLVVGGGDSAVEAALGLAEQPGNEVTLSYRKESFFRVRSRNEERLKQAASRGNLRVLLASQVTAIHPGEVEIAIQGTHARTTRVANDEVFVMAGGIAPFELLERSGVSFDPALRKAAEPVTEQGTGLLPALTIGFSLALLTLAFALWNRDYYSLPSELRPTDSLHALLRPGRGLGLVFGLTAAGLIVVNLLYLLRRHGHLGFTFGSLRAWMTSHVATGILALLCALLHAAMAPRDTAGGHAFAALFVLLVTGAIGRYFYAWVPRAANGRELEIEEVKLRLATLTAEAEPGQGRFVERVRREVQALVHAHQWQSSFFGRVRAFVLGQRELEGLMKRLAAQGEREGVPAERIAETLHLARRAHRTTLAAAHMEDLRAVLNTWRYLHRWVAALMVVLVVLHIVHALTYGELLGEVSR